MKRIYDTGTKDDVSMFVGTEVEHTPQYGKKTLFVVGIKNIEDIQKFLMAGADKVSLNSSAVKNPRLIKDASKVFGKSVINLSPFFNPIFLNEIAKLEILFNQLE